MAGVVTGSNLNIRDRPEIAGQKIGFLPPASRVEITELLIRHGEGDPLREEWGKLAERDGWIALWYRGTELARIDDSPPCWELPITRVSVFGPLVGFKTVPGATGAVLRDFADNLPPTIGGIAFVVQDAPLSTVLHAAGIVTVFVPWSQFPGDCPNMSMNPITSAVDRVRYVENQSQGATFDAIVMSNECTWPSVDFYRAWALEALDLCDARGWLCIPTVWYTGSPELEWLPALDSLHCSMARRGHPFGVNIYPYYPVSLMARDSQTQYTTWRFELIKERMVCEPLWLVTELAPDGGGWPPDVTDTAAFIKTTWGEFDGVGAWYYGGNNPLSAWPQANWTQAQMVSLAQQLN